MKKELKKEKPSRLTLHSETIRLLDEQILRWQVNGGATVATTTEQTGFVCTTC